MELLFKMFTRIGLMGFDPRAGFFPMSGGGARNGYQIQRSLRLRGWNSAYLSRVFGTPTNNSIFSFSAWVKRGTLGTRQGILGRYIDGNNSFRLSFDTDDTLFINDTQSAATVCSVKTPAAFRDPSALYHVVMVIDASNAIAGLRNKLYVNGVFQAGAVITNYTMAPLFNRASVSHDIGHNVDAGPVDRFFDGHIAEVYFVDGQALSPYDFGFTDPATGQWKPKKYTGTYGANGFYLDFKDPSSLTTLMLDRSGNGNNWSDHGISVTAGVNYDSMTDVPLTVGTTDRGNYSMLSPLDAHAYVTVRSGGLQVMGNTVTDSGAVRGTQEVLIPSYWETTITSVGGISYAGAGILSPKSFASAEAYGIASGASGGMFCRSGGGPLTSGYGGYGAASFTSPAFTTGDVIGVAVDPVNGAMYMHKNGTWMNGGVPTSGASRTGATHTWTPGSINVFPAGGGYNSSINDFNFGQRPFVYTPPTGFKNLHTGNMPEPTGAAAKPWEHHYVITLNKSGNTDFTLPWDASAYDTIFEIKRRDAVGNWYQIDGLRGYDKYLSSNSTAAETTDANVLGVAGTTITLKSSLADGVYVVSAWKAGLASARQTNTAGSITSTVSANTVAGISIVTYTGTGANATVGHGLGVQPKLILAKQRNSAGNNWVVFSMALRILVDVNQVLYLNATNATTGDATVFGAEPTSSSINIKTSSGVNGSGSTYVAYCFSEVQGFSKFGSYGATGNADGPNDVCRFTPRSLTFKWASSTSSWPRYDTAREMYNVMGSVVYADLASAEVSSPPRIDVLSNGFKLRTTGEPNYASGTGIFSAFAGAPFKYANAR